MVQALPTFGSRPVSQCREARRGCPWAREGLEEACGCAGEAPCPGEERRRATTSLSARQRRRHGASDVAHAEGAAQRALGASRRARGGWFTSAWRIFPARNQGTRFAGMGTGAPVLGLRPTRACR